jgi:hypothetical protein
VARAVSDRGGRVPRAELELTRSTGCIPSGFRECRAKSITQESALLAARVLRLTGNARILFRREMADVAEGWVRPIADPAGSEFGEKRGVKRHYGVDFPASEGTPVVSAAGGWVRRARWNHDFGYTVVVDHGPVDGKYAYTLYGHLSSMTVAVGQQVQPGDQLGLSGNTGRASKGFHLHFELIESPRELVWPDTDEIGYGGREYRVDPGTRLPDVLREEKLVASGRKPVPSEIAPPRDQPAAGWLANPWLLLTPDERSDVLLHAWLYVRRLAQAACVAPKELADLPVNVSVLLEPLTLYEWLQSGRAPASAFDDATPCEDYVLAMIAMQSPDIQAALGTPPLRIDGQQLASWAREYHTANPTVADQLRHLVEVVLDAARRFLEAAFAAESTMQYRWEAAGGPADSAPRVLTDSFSASDTRIDLSHAEAVVASLGDIGAGGWS